MKKVQNQKTQSSPFSTLCPIGQPPMDEFRISFDLQSRGWSVWEVLNRTMNADRAFALRPNFLNPTAQVLHVSSLCSLLHIF